MTVNEIVDELRSTRPRASDALRLQVLSLASEPAAAPRPLLARFRNRRLALLVPATAALAVASAVAIGVTRSGSPDELAATAPETVQRSAGSTGEALVGPPAAADASAPGVSTRPFRPLNERSRTDTRPSRPRSIPSHTSGWRALT